MNTIDIITIYTEKTGKIIPESQKAQYEAWGRRAIAMLESKLGWPLAGGGNTEVIGVSKHGCSCEKVDYKPEDLEPAPEAIGDLRILPMNKELMNLPIDPFKSVYRVYLARSIRSTEPSSKQKSVILKEVTKFEPKFHGMFGRFLEGCQKVSPCSETCNNDCKNCVSILVDANWVTINDLPDDIIYILCDYIDWVAEGGLSSRNIQSEEVDGHKVSYGDAANNISPFETAENLAIILDYAGPFGRISRKYIR